MPNIQQPEMRRSGHDPLVQDHRQETAQNKEPPDKGRRGTVPAEQVSPYGRAPDDGRTEDLEDGERRD